MRLLRRRATGGFTLVEVLVSIVVLSFGMLGIVGVQAFALQSNREARLQSHAVNLARELAEMMRGNNQIGIKSAAADNPYLLDATSPLGFWMWNRLAVVLKRPQSAFTPTSRCFVRTGGNTCPALVVPSGAESPWTSPSM